MRGRKRRPSKVPPPPSHDEQLEACLMMKQYLEQQRDQQATMAAGQATRASGSAPAAGADDDVPPPPLPPPALSTDSSVSSIEDVVDTATGKFRNMSVDVASTGPPPPVCSPPPLPISPPPLSRPGSFVSKQAGGGDEPAAEQRLARSASIRSRHDSFASNASTTRVGRSPSVRSRGGMHVPSPLSPPHERPPLEAARWAVPPPPQRRPPPALPSAPTTSAQPSGSLSGPSVPGGVPRRQTNASQGSERSGPSNGEEEGAPGMRRRGAPAMPTAPTTLTRAASSRRALSMASTAQQQQQQQQLPVPYTSGIPAPMDRLKVVELADRSAVEHVSFRLESMQWQLSDAIELKSSAVLALRPQFVSVFARISVLDLEDNKLSQLPVEIGDLVQLRTLNVAQNKLISLPLELGEMASLQTVNLQANLLETLPCTLGDLTDLRLLNVSRNRLTELPNELTQLPALHTLLAFDNQLTSLPPDIGKLDQLTTLDIHANNLANLPAGIGRLHRLRHFQLSHNRLASLPSEIVYLNQLSTLDLQHNRLHALPVEMGLLVALVQLKLHNNMLEQLPESCRALKALKTVSLHGNALRPVPWLVPSSPLAKEYQRALDIVARQQTGASTPRRPSASSTTPGGGETLRRRYRTYSAAGGGSRHRRPSAALATVFDEPDTASASDASMTQQRLSRTWSRGSTGSASTTASTGSATAAGGTLASSASQRSFHRSRSSTRIGPGAGNAAAVPPLVFQPAPSITHTVELSGSSKASERQRGGSGGASAGGGSRWKRLLKKTGGSGSSSGTRDGRRGGGSASGNASGHDGAGGGDGFAPAAMPPAEQWQSLFEVMLDDQRLPEAKRGALRALSAEKRWQLFSLHRPQQAQQLSESLITQPVMVAASVRETPSAASVAVVLAALKEPERSEDNDRWIEQFISADGVPALLLALTGVSECSPKTERMIELQISVVEALRLLSRHHQILPALCNAEAIRALVFALDAPCLVDRTRTLELLADLAIMPAGHPQVVAAFTAHAAAMQLQHRFSVLFDALHVTPADDSNVGNNKLIDVAEHLFAAMCLINAIITTPSALETRIALRRSFLRMGIEESLVMLRRGNPGPEMDAALHHFEDEMEYDDREAAESRRRSVALGAVGDGRDAESVLVIYLPDRHGTVTMPYTQETTGADVMAFARQHSMAAGDRRSSGAPAAAAATDYGLHAAPSASNGFAGVWIQPQDRLIDDIGIRGQVAIEYKLVPITAEVCVRVSPEDKGLAQVCQLDPNVSVASTIASLLAEARDLRPDDFALTLTGPDGEASVWLKDERSIASYSLHRIAPGFALQCRAKLKPVQIHISETGETRVFKLDPYDIVAAAVAQVAATAHQVRAASSRHSGTTRRHGSAAGSMLSHTAAADAARRHGLYRESGTAGKQGAFLDASVPLAACALPDMCTLVYRPLPQPVLVQLPGNASASVTIDVSVRVGMLTAMLCQQHALKDYEYQLQRIPRGDQNALAEAAEEAAAAAASLAQHASLQAAVSRHRSARGSSSRRSGSIAVPGSGSGGGGSMARRTRRMTITLASLGPALALAVPPSPIPEAADAAAQASDRDGSGSDDSSGEAGDGAGGAGDAIDLLPALSLAEQGWERGDALRLARIEALVDGMTQVEEDQLDEDLWTELLPAQSDDAGAASSSTDLVDRQADGAVAAASLNTLIAVITESPDCEPELRRTLLMTYRTFTTPRVLLLKLLQRYMVPVPESGPSTLSVRSIQLATLHVLRYWLQQFPMDLSLPLLDLLRSFVKDQVDKDGHLAIANTMRALMNAVHASKTPQTPAVRTRGGGGGGKRLQDLSLWDDDEKDLAEHLTAIDFHLFARIRPVDLLNNAWSKRSASSSSVRVMIDRWNAVAGWLSTEILLESHVRNRAKMIGKAIKLGMYLRSMHNFNSLMAVVAALDNTAVERLSFSFQKVPSRLQQAREELERVTSPGSNYAGLREALRDAAPPTIPYLGMYLTEITFIEDGLPSLTDSGAISVAKRRRLVASIDALLAFQKTPYMQMPEATLRQVQAEDWAADLPLVLSDEDQYQLSLKREPRHASADEIR